MKDKDIDKDDKDVEDVNETKQPDIEYSPLGYSYCDFCGRKIEGEFESICDWCYDEGYS